MSLSDTAEYWHDVHRRKPPYNGKDFYHIPKADCGHHHYYEAKMLGDVNCYACLELIKQGYDHGLPEGKSSYLPNTESTKKGREKARKAEEKRLKDEKIARLRKENGSCPKCGSYLLIRKNRTTKEQFFGCSNFPQCKFTRSFEISYEPDNDLLHGDYGNRD